MFAKAAITGTLQAGTTTFDAEYLVVAGGGGGASAYGGGGAGGYRTANNFSIALGSPYAVTVGAGAPADAAGGPLGSQGGDGGDSTFATITSTGGGGGSSYDSATPGPLADGRDGGSGGGGGYTPAGSSGGSGNTPAVSPSQGNDGGGGSPSAPYYGGGGGGGAGAVGANGTSTNGGAGGAGLESYITGSSVYRAGGGGGGNYSANNGGAGGIGGGGNAGSAGVAGAAGAANTGGGGGGGHAGAAGVGAWTGGGAGGSGVVIIRVPSTVVAEFSAGVVYNYIPLDDFNVYEITAAGVSDTVTFSEGAVTTVGESLLFNDDDSAYLSRTPASAGDRKTWTWSAWVKRGNLSSNQTLFEAGNGSVYTLIWFASNDKLGILEDQGGGGLYFPYTTAVFRDVSAWYHIVVSVDTTQATSTNRIKIYVNGVQQTIDNSYPSQNLDTYVNSTNAHRIGYRVGNSAALDGYLSDVYFIDGEALDPSRFGKQDADGIWQPITYTGSYGTNGFHLDFADNSTAAALGTDTSGNGNDWTPSGITTDDQVTDTPSVNYATWNPLIRSFNTFANGNLDVTTSITAPAKIVSTIGASSGKYYMEYVHQGNNNWPVGIAADNRERDYLGMSDGNTSVSFWCATSSTTVYINGVLQSFSGSATTWAASDIVGIALDVDNEEVSLYKNGTLVGAAVSFAAYGWTQAFFAAGNYVSGNQYITNFGQRPFAYTPPTGFQALNSSNLPAPTITDGKEHFQPVLYTGNGTSQTVRGLEFQPDFVWIKNRDATWSHFLQDAIRGAQQYLLSNATSAEGSSTTTLTSFTTNGFSVGSSPAVNASGQNHVAWNWNAGGSTVTNTDGTITSQVRANTDAGFSIVTWTSDGSTDGRIGHGLLAAPELVITKNRGGVNNWYTVTTVIDGSYDYLFLNTTAAKTDVTNGTAPTVTTFSNSAFSNTNTMLAYCFHSVDGFSKFGSYTGNGSADGPFVYTGFRPAFVMIKRTDSTGGWIMLDNKRDIDNPEEHYLIANLSNAETTDINLKLDALSNGFKLRANSSATNASGGTHIFMAFAENPFKTARAR